MTEHEYPRATPDAPGCIILADESMEALQWHHSVDYDGHVHTTGCGREIPVSDVRDVETPAVDAWNKNVPPVNGCKYGCYDSIRDLREAQQDDA